MNFGLTEQYRWRLDRLLEAVGSQDPRPHVTRLFIKHCYLHLHYLHCILATILPAIMDEVDTFTSGRTVDIDLGTAEVITIDLDNLDPNPDDVLDLLKDGQCKDWVWTKLAGEYWRKGYLEGAERIALTAVDCERLALFCAVPKPLIHCAAFQSSGSMASLPPIYYLLANLTIARSRLAPKHILADARM